VKRRGSEDEIFKGEEEDQRGFERVEKSWKLRGRWME